MDPFLRLPRAHNGRKAGKPPKQKQPTHSSSSSPQPKPHHHAK